MVTYRQDHEFYYDDGHLVMWLVFQPPVLYITCFLHTNSFMLALMLEVLKE